MTGRDAHAIGIGADIREDGKRRAIAPALDLHEEPSRLPSNERLERGDEEGALSGEPLERRAHRADERGIGAHARHQQEVALAGSSDRDPAAAPGGDHVGPASEARGRPGGFTNIVGRIRLTGVT